MRIRIRSTAILIAVLFTLTACGGKAPVDNYERDLKGLTDALSYLSGDATRTVLDIRMDMGGTKTLTYDGFFDLAKGQLKDGLDADGALDLETYKLDVRLIFNLDEAGNAAVVIGLPDDGSYSKLLEAYFVDDALYIGTGIIKDLVNMATAEMSSEDTMMINMLFGGMIMYDYISISMADLEGVTGMTGTDLGLNSDADETVAQVTALVEKFAGIIQKDLSSIITKDMKALSSNDEGYYILQMNAENIVAAAGSLFGVIEANAQDIADALNSLDFIDADMTRQDVVDFARDSVEGTTAENAPEDFRLIVMAKGENDEQDINIRVSGTDPDTGKAVNIEVLLYATKQVGNISAPMGSMFALSDLINSLFGGMSDYGMDFDSLYVDSFLFSEMVWDLDFLQSAGMSYDEWDVLTDLWLDMPYMTSVDEFIDATGGMKYWSFYYDAYFSER